MPAYLHGLATALPPHVLDQDAVKLRAARVFGASYPQIDRLLPSFDTAGVETRHSVVSLDWFEHSHGWADRNREYLQGARALFVDAATAALADAGWRAGDVDCVVTVSSTGVATPTLEAQVWSEMGFRDDIMRVPLFGLGCAGGVSGLSVAEALAAADPEQRVLLVVIEACTISFRSDRLRKADIIAAVLFGDGAAAACVSARDPTARRITLRRGYQRIWPDTLGIMGWDVDDTGLGVVFDRSIPDFVTERFAEATARAREAAHLADAQIDRYVCHPGGAKVVTAIEGALHLPQGSLQAERDVLRRAGNMSAPTVLFVLQDVLAEPRHGTMLACALGPGFTASFLPFDVEKAA